MTTTMTPMTDAQTRAFTLTPGLTPRAETAIRRVSTFTVLVLAAAAAVLSYAGLTQLAVDAQINPHLTFLFPVVVDGLTLVGGMQVLHSTLTGLRSWYGWLLTLLGVGASVVGNIAASPVDPMARAVHAAPPIVLALALEALLRVYRHRVTQSHREQIHAMELLTAKDAAAERAEVAAARERTKAQDARVLREAEAATALAVRVAREAEAALSWAPGTVPATASATVPESSPSSQPAPTAKASSVPAPPAALASPDFDIAALGVSADATLREQISATHSSDPNLTGSQIARLLGSDRSYTSKVLRELQSETPTIVVVPAPPVQPAPVVVSPALTAAVAPAAVTPEPVRPAVAGPAPAPVAPTSEAAMSAMDLPMFSDDLFNDSVPVRELQPEPV